MPSLSGLARLADGAANRPFGAACGRVARDEREHLAARRAAETARKTIDAVAYGARRMTDACADRVDVVAAGDQSQQLGVGEVEAVRARHATEGRGAASCVP